MEGLHVLTAAKLTAKLQYFHGEDSAFLRSSQKLINTCGEITSFKKEQAQALALSLIWRCCTLTVVIIIPCSKDQQCLQLILAEPLSFVESWETLRTHSYLHEIDCEICQRPLLVCGDCDMARRILLGNSLVNCASRQKQDISNLQCSKY